MLSRCNWLWNLQNVYSNSDVRSANYEITSDNIKEVLHIEIAKRFAKVLECAGVFKRTEKGMDQFKKFLSVL